MSLAIVEKAHRQAVEHDLAEIASELQSVLGQSAVAYAVGEMHPKTIGRYARGDRQKIDRITHGRLTDLYTATSILQERLGSGAVRRWMFGRNPRLSWQSPIDVVHDDRAGEVIEVAAAYVEDR